MWQLIISNSNFQRQEFIFAKENCYIILFHAVGKALTNHFE